MKLKDALDASRGERQIKKADKYATKQHEGQTRKGNGEPYVNHPKRVAAIIRKYKDSKEIYKIIQASLLHDTREDTSTTEKDLKRKFGKLVASLVGELTSDKEEMAKQGGKRLYLANKTQKMSSWALVIKLADRLDNVSDFSKMSDEFVKNYTKQTNYILDELEKKRKLSGTQKALIRDIRKSMINFKK